MKRTSWRLSCPYMILGHLFIQNFVCLLTYSPKCKLISRKKKLILETEIFFFHFSFTSWTIGKQTVDVQINIEPIE